MDIQSQPVRYWSLDGPMPETVVEGRITTGIAFHVETEERLVYVRVHSRESDSPVVWEMWLDGTTAHELMESLRMLEPWYGLAATEADEAKGGRPS